MKNADSRGPQGAGFLPLRHDKYDANGWDLEMRSALWGYAVLDRFVGDDNIGEWHHDQTKVGDVVGALCWPNDSRPMPGWSWVWPALYGEAGDQPEDVASEDTGGVVIAQAGDPNDPGLLQSLGPPNGFSPGGPSSPNAKGDVLTLGINKGRPGINGGQGFYPFTVGGKGGLEALSGLQGVGNVGGFGGFSYGGSRSTEALTGLQGVGAGSGFAHFIQPADPYRNPFGNKNSPQGQQNPGGRPVGPGQWGGDGNGAQVGLNGDSGAEGLRGVPGAKSPGTGGDKQDGCGVMMPGDSQLRPVKDDSWKPDKRYKGIDANFPKVGKDNLWPKFPKGTPGLVVSATDESKQVELFFPTDPNLYAVNHGGDPGMGTLVYDVTKKFEADRQRKAPLQSVFWVLKKPLGGMNSVAFQLGPSGCQDTEGGFFIDRGEQAAPPPMSSGADPVTGAVAAPKPGDPTADKSKSRIVGHGSRWHGGPLWVGSATDKHKLGKTGDNFPINPLHLWTGALFKRDDRYDGPLAFETEWRSGQDKSVVVPVHLGWNDGAQMWMWWSTTDHYSPPPPYPPPPYYPPPPPSDPMPPPCDPNMAPPTPCYPPGSPPSPPMYPSPPMSPGSPPMSPCSPQPCVPTTDPLDPYRNDPNYHKSGAPVGQLSYQDPQIVATDSNVGEGMRTTTSVSPTQASAFAAQAQNYTPGATDTGVFSQPTTASVSKAIHSNPTTLVASAFGAQGGTIAGAVIPTTPPSPFAPPPSPPPPPPGPPSPPPPPPPPPSSSPSTVPAGGDPFNYTQAPKGTRLSGKSPSKWSGGTADGGLVIHPPETDLRDAARRNMKPGSGVSRSKTSLIVAPNAYFGAGTPELVNGQLKEGYFWGTDEATGDLVFESMTSSQFRYEAVRFTKGNQRIRWLSMSKDPAKYGEIWHANTTGRAYFCPDISGTVMVTANLYVDGAGAPVAAGKLGGPGPITGFDKWILVMCSDGTQRYVEAYV